VLNECGNDFYFYFHSPLDSHQTFGRISPNGSLSEVGLKWLTFGRWSALNDGLMSQQKAKMPLKKKKIST